MVLLKYKAGGANIGKEIFNVMILTSAEKREGKV